MKRVPFLLFLACVGFGGVLAYADFTSDVGSQPISPMGRMASRADSSKDAFPSQVAASVLPLSRADNTGGRLRAGQAALIRLSHSETSCKMTAKLIGFAPLDERGGVMAGAPMPSFEVRPNGDVKLLMPRLMARTVTYRTFVEAKFESPGRVRRYVVYADLPVERSPVLPEA